MSSDMFSSTLHSEPLKPQVRIDSDRNGHVAAFTLDEPTPEQVTETLAAFLRLVGGAA